MNCPHAQTCEDDSPSFAVDDTSSRALCKNAPGAKHIQAHICEQGVSWELLCREIGHFLNTKGGSQPSAFYIVMDDIAHALFAANNQRAEQTAPSV